MKICSYGTTRVDYYLYLKDTASAAFDEYKINDLEKRVGGSVFNTTVILKLLNLDLEYFTIIGNDELGSLCKKSLLNYNIKYTCSLINDVKSPVTFIHLNCAGEKVMYSFDGNVHCHDIINELQESYESYDFFFTSCYEINSENYIKLSAILDEFKKKSKKNFLDLSPLIYSLAKNIWEKILPSIYVLTGTEHEFDLLINILGYNSINELIINNNINKIYIKKGSKGCSVISYDGSVIDYFITPIQSKNLTGCGDAFNAGVIFGEINNFKTNETIKLASDLASNVARIGFEPVKIVNDLKITLCLA